MKGSIVPNASIRIRSQSSADDKLADATDVSSIILDLSGLLFSLARHSFSLSQPAKERSANEQPIVEMIVLQLRERISMLPSLATFFPAYPPSDEQLSDAHWWLEGFPRTLLDTPCIRQIECDTQSRTVQLGNTTSESYALHAIRSACLYLIEQNTIQTSFQTICQSEAKRQIYNLVYGLSHEINNPLANISARAEQLISRTSNASDRKSLATIVDQAMKAHEMIAELMLAVQIPKLNTGKIVLGEFLSQVEETIRPKFENAKIQFEVLATTSRESIVGDRTALLEAVLCGLRNALENCRIGDRVQLVVETLCDSSSRSLNEIRMAIVDNGPGMTPTQIANAWDLFYSGREAGRGLGMGLAKLQRVVELHSGRVWMESVPGGGTSLEIRLPKPSDSA
jgi:signal transduction histidine kinase